MAIKRKITNIYTPEGQPGFLGAGHMARPVIRGGFSYSDPFIFLMDDWLDKKDNQPVGGPHPHAGFETVSLLLEGELGDETHKMKSGDLEMMTAGGGIVHTETIEKKTKMRLLQLWLALPKKDRWATPRLQNLPLEHVPSLAENGVAIKLYSGSLAGLVSPVQNYAPLILADITMNDGSTTVLQLPANFNTFLYVLEGNVTVGDDEKLMTKDQVGWLNLFGDEKQSELKVMAGEEGARFVLYAGKPTGDSIVSHGPFIADTNNDIQRLYKEYRQGKIKHIATVAESQRIFL
jgi:redox-sensitive bicupin YhaK (pirin superfamily)